MSLIEHKDGSGDSKTGSVVGGTAKDGKVLKSSFFKNVPALGGLINRVRDHVERYGYIPAIDGRKIRIRSFEGRYLTHTALNALLQGSGSIVVKKALILANKEIKRQGLDAKQVIFYHDEVVVDCAEDIGEEVGEILVASLKGAGEFFNLRIPIDAEYHIGMTWGDVH